jgi:hypothetical protein
MQHLLVICCEHMQTAHIVKYSISYTRLLCPLVGFKTVVHAVLGKRVHGGQNNVACPQFLRTDKNMVTALKSLSLPLTSHIFNKCTRDDTCWEYRDKKISTIRT